MTILFMMFSAFMQGVSGSLHCVAMCGPLMALAAGRSAKVISVILYNMGKTFIYFLTGILLGYFGSHLSSYLSSDLLAVTGGIFVILFGITYMLPNNPFKLPKILNLNFIFSKMGNFFRNSASKKYITFLSGCISGLLPCGLLYAAYGLAISSGSAAKGGLIMLFFGLGTMPVLSLAGFSVMNFLNRKELQKLKPVLGLFMILLGFFIIYLRMKNGDLQGNLAAECH